MHRKFSSLWRDLPGTVIRRNVQEFITAAAPSATPNGSPRPWPPRSGPGPVRHRQLPWTRSPTTTSTPSRTAKPRHDKEATGRTWKHYRACATATRTVLFHHGVLPAHQSRGSSGGRSPTPGRRAKPMRSILVRYLDRKSVTCKTTTVSSWRPAWPPAPSSPPSRPDLTPAGLDRVRHIEPWLVALTRTKNTRSGGLLSVPEQARRILAVANFFTEITEWDWPEAPARKLLYASDSAPAPAPAPLPPARGPTEP